jgi:uncharacterized protein (DUF983 family)
MRAIDWPQIRRVLWSGLRRKCPRCHRGPLFVKRYTLHERCLECDYPISAALDYLVILTYVGSASITGLFLLAVFVIRSPKSGFEMLIYLLVAVGLQFGTMQYRKGLAIGLIHVHNLLFGEEAEEVEES